MGAMGCVMCWFLSPWTLACFAAAVAFKVWYKATIGMCRSTRRLEGRTALITGANTGIGLETAKDLARRGARVLLACRDPQRGMRALEEVRAVASTGASVHLLSLDLGSLESVRACAKKVNETEKRLDILINNAGAASLGRSQTRDGLHRGLQVNHFGPFLFTLLLVDLLKKSAPSRIVFVSSLMHRFAFFKPEMLDLPRARKIGDTQIYCITKLLNVIVSNELARRLRGTGVTSNSLHPGAILSNIYNRMPKWMNFIITSILRVFCKNVVEGAQTTIHVAVSEELEGITGKYFSDCEEAGTSSLTRDEALVRAVWTKSEELVALKDEERPKF